MKFKELPNHQTKNKVFAGLLNCYNLELTSLEGCYEEIGGDFNCRFNRLTSLKYCPEIVKGNFDCSYNFLNTLKYFPKKIEGTFDCRNNISLINAKKQIIENGIVAKYYYTDEESFTYDEIKNDIEKYQKRLKLLEEVKPNLKKMKNLDYGLSF